MARRKPLRGTAPQVMAQGGSDGRTDQLGPDRSYGLAGHVYGTGLALCSQTSFQPLPEQQLRPDERFAAPCRACRIQAWDRTHPGLTYPSP